MKLIITAVMFFCNLAVSTEALKCWTCENARSNDECRRTGREKTCQANEEACQTHVRTDPQGIRITKECKQAHACNNNYIQNPRHAWVPSQCNRNVQGSVCRCCCNFDNCNFMTLDCPAGPPPTSPPVTESSGLDQPTCPEVRFRNGTASCTNGNQVGSTCTFNCADGFTVHPANYTHSECDGSTWQEPIPCCTRPCPPFARADAIVVLDSSSSVRRQNWLQMINFVVTMLDQFVIDESSLRVGAFRYNR
uniref:Sushi domain-containing protein n=1 Tax=Ciona savignyi TaxID=51511 RepID=H2Z6J6_CIOSA